MHHGTRATGFALVQFDRSQQSGRVLELRDVGEETTDLDFRMDAGCDAAEDFDNVVVVDDDAGVGLLAIDGKDFLDFSQG